MPSPADRSADASGAGAALVARLATHTWLYAFGSFLTLAFALVNLAVLTRFLSVAEFGRLALLFLFAAFLAVVYNLGSLQGSFMWVFGSSGEEEHDEADQASVGHKRQALGSAVALTAAISAAGTSLTMLAAPLVADLLLGTPESEGAVRWASLSGGLGAVWRLLSNVPRLERQPGRFIALSAARPVLALCFVVPLAATGAGAEGILAGVAAATGLSIVLAFVLIRRSHAFALRTSDVRQIVRRGRVFVPLIAALWVVQNADLFLLSRFAPDAEVGVYRVASRIGSVASYLIAAFLMAWGPLQRSTAFTAAEEVNGPMELAGRFVTYFCFAGFGLILVMAEAAEWVVRAAPPSYAGAAPVVPLVAAGFVAYGIFVAAYRASRFPHRRGWYIGLACLAAGLMLPLSLVMIPWLGAEGAALAVVVAFVPPIAIMMYRSQRGPTPIELSWLPIAVTGASAVFLIAGARLIPDDGIWQVTTIAVVVAYPSVILAAGFVPRHYLVLLWRAGRRRLTGAGPRHHEKRRLRSMSLNDRTVLQLLLRDGQTRTDVAVATRIDEPELPSRLVRALRAVEGRSDRSQHDDAIGEYLLSSEPPAARDQAARRLLTAGAAARDLSQLEDLAGRLRGARPWR